MKRVNTFKGHYRIISVIALFTVAALVAADGLSPHLKFIGNLTQLRKGLSDNMSLDLIVPKDIGGQPLCLKLEEDLKVTWIDPAPGVQWKVIRASLKSDVDGEVHWLMVSETDFMEPGTVWDLPGDMPSYVDKCTLRLEIVASRADTGEGEDPDGDPPVVVGSNTVYVTVDTPKDLMSVPWTNLLDWSTVAAHIATNQFWANYYMTDRLWLQGNFDPSVQRFAVSSLTEHKDTFYLRRFLEANFIGRSSDFGDFLACAMMSLGVTGSGVRRSYPNDKIMGWPYPAPPSGRHYEIVTLPLKRAGQDSEASFTAPFHQFAEWQGYYWDGSVKYYTNFLWETGKGYSSAYLKSHLVYQYGADTDFDNVADITVAVGSTNDPWAPKKITIVLSAESATDK